MNGQDLIKHFSSSRKSRTKDGFTYIWFDHPYHLYYEEEQALAYLKMIEKDNFSKSLHDPIEYLVKKYAKSIINESYKKIEFYDLGPGLPTKTIPLLLEIKRKKIPLKYIPVDISRSFLKITENVVSKYNINSQGINGLFEELPLRVKEKEDDSITRIFQIGLTFNNYRPNKILKLLENLTRPNDFNLIITEFYRSSKKETLLLPYQDIYAENFNFLALELIGLNKKDFVYHTEYKNQRIEMGFIPKKIIKIGKTIITKKRTKIVTAISYRYTQFSLTNNIQKYFKQFELFRENDLVIYKIKD